MALLFVEQEIDSIVSDYLNESFNVASPFVTPGILYWDVEVLCLFVDPRIQFVISESII